MKPIMKYDLFSIIITVIVLTVLAIGALIYANFTGTLGGELKDNAQDMVNDGSIDQENADYATNFAANDIPKFADNYVFWFFVAIFIGLMLTAMYLEFEPVILIVIFIFGSIAILGAWLGSNIHSEFAADDTLSDTANQMSKTKLLMSSPYFPIFIFTGLVIMIILMYSKKRSSEYQ